MAPLSVACCGELLRDIIRIGTGGEDVSGAHVLQRWNHPGSLRLPIMVFPITLVVVNSALPCLMCSAHAMLYRPRFSSWGKTSGPLVSLARCQNKTFVEHDPIDETPGQVAKGLRTIVDNFRCLLPGGLAELEEWGTR